MIFKNNKTALKFTTLFMAIIMLLMLILPTAPVLAITDASLYTLKVEKLIQNIYDKFLEDGNVVASSNTELDGLAIYVLNKANVDVLKWEYEGITVEKKLDALIADAITKEADASTAINAKHMANLYIAAESSNKTTEASKLLNYLKIRQKNTVNGGFLDGDYSEYTNLPTFDILAMEGKLNTLENHGKAFEYVKNLNPIKSDFPDFMSISQTARILKGFEVQLRKENVSKLTQPILEWLKNNQAPDGSFNAGGGDATTNTSEVLWTMESLGTSTTLTADGSNNALKYLIEKDVFANIGANVWTIRALLLNGAEPKYNPTKASGSEEAINTIKIRIEGPDYTILPETEVEVKGSKSYSDILIENAKKLGYTVQESGGFLNSINDIQGQSYWAVSPYQETYTDGDSFVFYAGGSGNIGDITIIKDNSRVGGFIATVKAQNGDPVQGATVIYYAKDKIKTPTTIEIPTDEKGNVLIKIDKVDEYYFAAYKINTGVYPDPDNGLVRTLPTLPSVQEIKVKLAIIDDNSQLIYGPKTVILRDDDKFALTALGSLDKTGLDYNSGAKNDFVTKIEKVENQGLSGWMYSVNGAAPDVSAIDKILKDGDKVLWYYSKSSTANVPNFPKASFVDIGTDMNWAKEAIEALSVKGIIEGSGNNKFEPKRPISRGEFSKLVVETLGENTFSKSASTFSDVNSTKWYAKYVDKAFEKGLIKGSNGKFRPMENITRNEVAVILHSMENNASPSNEKIDFKDSETIADWAKNSVAYAVEKGLIKGYNDNTFRGQQAMTRAEVAVVLYRYIQMEK